MHFPQICYILSTLGNFCLVEIMLHYEFCNGSKPLLISVVCMGGDRIMRLSFCKNSVFCVLFYVSFFLGTICGVLFLRCMLVNNYLWLSAYCHELQRTAPNSFLLLGWFQLLPFLAAVLIYFLPHKDKLFPALIFLRGCISAYTVGAYYMLDVPLADILLYSLLLFPAFFAVCRWLWGTI